MTKNFDNAAVERIILKCNHKILIGDLSDIIYVNKSDHLKRINSIKELIYFI